MLSIEKKMCTVEDYSGFRYGISIGYTNIVRLYPWSVAFRQNMIKKKKMLNTSIFLKKRQLKYYITIDGIITLINATKDRKQNHWECKIALLLWLISVTRKRKISFLLFEISKIVSVHCSEQTTVVSVFECIMLSSREGEYLRYS